MGYTLAALKTMISTVYTTFDVSDDTIQTDIIKQAMINTISELEEPKIPQTLTVLQGTSKYSVPSILKYEKLIGIRDSNDEDVAYSIDDVSQKIVLRTAPAENDIYNVYGVPKVSTSNMETVLSYFDEDFQDIFYSYIDYWVYQSDNNAEADAKLVKANVMARSRRRRKNRRLDLFNRTVQQRDTTGAIVADALNSDGLESNNSSFLDVSTEF